MTAAYHRSRAALPLARAEVIAVRLPSLRRRRARAPVAAVLGVIALLAAACGGSGSPASSSSKSTTPAHAGTAGGTSAGATTVDLATVGGYGSVLVTSTGRALYLLTADTGGTSACTGACTGIWPPLVTHGAPVAGNGVTASLLGRIRRPGGGTQVTYGGHPLYTYSGDTTSTQANGQGIHAYGGTWYVVGASGKAVTASSGSSSTTSGGYGY